MKSFPNKLARKTFVRQQDQTDCGVAALLSVLRYHGGNAPLERLREQSGTSRQGTTLLGLYQAAERLGFDTSALQADGTENLKTADFPCLLHIVKDGRLQHYVVCYGYDARTDTFYIGDPASGLGSLPARELDSLWVSKALLKLAPNERFVRSETLRREKFQWLRSIVEDDITVLFVAFALGVVIAAVNLSTAVFSQKLVDVILPGRDSVKLYVGLALLTALLAARSGLQFLRRRFLLAQSRDFNKRLINRFFGILLRLPQAFFDNRKTGDLIARMNDAQRLQQALTYLASEVMIDVLAFIVSAALVFFYSVPIGVFILCSVSLYFLLAQRFHRPIVAGQQSVMAAYALNESNYIDVIQGVSTIKAAGNERYFTRKTRAFYEFFQDSAYILGNVGIRFNLAAELIGVIIFVVTLSWASALALQGAMLAGALVAVIQTASQTNAVSVRLALTNIRLQEARVAFERLNAFASVAPEYDEETESAKRGIEAFESLRAEGLRFRFPGRAELFGDVSFEARRGETIAFAGASGAGKSTILRLIERLYEPENGEIVINGAERLDAINLRSWRGFLGVVPQDVKIFNGTVLENIALGDSFEADGSESAHQIAQAEMKRVVAFCRECGFERFIAQLPQGYATLVGEEGIALSGGQRQLLALARALYRKPQLLLLDEATSAMDAETETSVLELLRRLNPQMGIIMVTHRDRVLDYACRSYEMRGGRLEEKNALTACSV